MKGIFSICQKSYKGTAHIQHKDSKPSQSEQILSLFLKKK